MYVRLVGVVKVADEADAVESRPVGSRKARTLVALFGARRDRLVTIDDAVAALWPDEPPQDPAANVATLVSRLRGRFGRDMIIGRRCGYRLGDSVRVDLYEAADLVEKAERLLSQPAHALLVAEQAMTLLDARPVLLEHPTAGWAEEARATQQSLLRRAWYVAAESALHTGAPRLAQVLAETLITTEPTDERAQLILRHVRSRHNARLTAIRSELRSDSLAAPNQA